MNNYGVGALVVASVTTWWSSAGAQGVDPKGQARLEEVIVTAQKREQNLQDVPIAVTALSGDTLAGARVDSTQELQAAVPSLNYSQSGARAQAYLRGVGNNITQEGNDPSVATYIDGVYISSSAVTITRLADVQSVEVLKGPQGTLYGRNATGGAINITTRAPKNEFESGVTMEVGNYSQKQLSGFLSGPLSDRLRAGIYVGGNERDPYAELQNPPGVPTPDVRDKEREYGGRGKLIFDATDSLTLSAAVDLVKYYSFEDLAWRQFQSNALGYVRGATPNTQDYSVSLDSKVSNVWESKGASLRADIDLQSTRIMAMSAFRKAEATWLSDGDATTAAVNQASAVSTGEQWSHELQWQADPSAKWQWIVGAYAYDNKGEQVPMRSATIAANGTGTLSETFASVDTTAYSAFAQTTYPLTDHLRATLGLRYTDEQKDYNGGSSQVYTLARVPVGVPVVAAPRSAKWTETTPKAVLDYTIGSSMLYASYSEGFKSGLFNLSNVLDVGPVDPESLVAYEVGSKSDLFDERLRLNTAVFYYDYTNLQVQALAGAGVGGTTQSQLVNAADAKIKGLELEVQAAVTGDLNFSLTVTGMDSEYVSFPGFPALASRGALGGNATISGGVDVSGFELARAPDWVGSVGGTYALGLDSGAEINFHANWYYNSGYFFNADHTMAQEAYNTTELSIRFVPASEVWSASVWGKNLTDTHYYNYRQVNAQGTYGIEAPPRTFGITFSYNFSGK